MLIYEALSSIKVVINGHKNLQIQPELAHFLWLNFAQDTLHS